MFFEYLDINHVLFVDRIMYFAEKIKPLVYRQNQNSSVDKITVFV